MGLSLTSCKKDYTCDCTIVSKTDDGAGNTTENTTESSITLADAKKKDAEEWCKGWDDTRETITVGSSTSSTDYMCNLK